MKSFKQWIITGLFTSSLIIAANTLAANVDYVLHAKEYFDKGEYKTAIIQLKNRLREEPKDAEARYLLAKSYLIMRDVKLAEKEITRAHQLNKESNEIALVYAEIMLLQGKYQEAIDVLDKKFSDSALEQQRQIYIANALLEQNKLADAKQILSELESKSENIAIYNGLAKIALLEKEQDVAATWLEKSMKIDPQNFSTLKIQAELALANKNYEQVLNIYNNLIQQQKNNLPIYLKRASIEIYLKNYADAEKDINIVLKEIENQPIANYLLAQIRLQEKNYQEAESTAQKVLTVSPRYYPAMLILGVANLAQGHFNQAEKYLIQYVYSSPNNLYAQSLLANVYLAQQSGEQALLILEDIDEEKRAKDHQILTTLGSAYLLLGEHEKGIAALNQAKALAPESKVIQQRLVSEHYRAGDYENAVIGLKQMVNSGKGDKQIKYLLTISYIQQNELEKATAQINSFLKETPDDAGLYNLVAVVEKINENVDKAEAAYKKSLQIDKNNFPAYIGIAQLAMAKDDFEQAKIYLKKLTQLNKEYLRAYLTLAAIAEKENDLQAVEQHLLDGFKNMSENAKAQLSIAVTLGKWYVQQKQPQKILPIARQLNAAHPDDLGTLSFLVAADIKNNRAPAENVLNKIIKNNNNDTRHRLILANLLAAKSGRENEAFRLLDEVLEITPESIEPELIKVALLIKLQEYNKAMAVADHIENKFADLPVGSQLKGGIYMKQKNDDKALESYQRAYKMQADQYVLVTMAGILVSRKNDSQAKKLLDGEIANKDEVNLILATLLQKNNRYNDALKYYQKVLDKNNGNVLVLNNMAWIYVQQNNPQALDFARKAYEKAPDSISIADTYGYTLVKNGRKAEGIAVLEKVLKRVPQARNIQFHLANAYYLHGEKDKAKAPLETIVNSGEEFTERGNAEKLLKKVSI